MADALQPGESPGFLLWRTTLRWQRRIGAALRPWDLTHVQYVVLVSTWWLTRVAGETPSQRRIAEHAGIDTMMTSQVVRALAARKLLERTTDPIDSRARVIEVTPAGAELAVKATRVVEGADEEFFQEVGDRDALMAILRALGR